MARPTDSEYAPFYAAYVGEVPERPVLEVLEGAPDKLEQMLAGLSAEDEHSTYAPGKWSIRELLGHVVDTERLFSFRALHMARADPSALPGMDHLVWAAASNAAERPVSSLLAEFRALRAANVELFASFDEEILSRRGTASGCEFTVRAMVYIVAGHQLHHSRILGERYLPGRRSGAATDG